MLSSALKAKIDAGMRLLPTEIEIEAVNEQQAGEGKAYRFRLFSKAENRNKWIVDPMGMQHAAYMKNPVILYNHEWDEPPIGNMSNIEVNSNSMYGTMTFHGLTERSREIESLIAAGAMRAGSVGFQPKEEILLDADDDDAWDWFYNGRISYPSAELLEYSIVTIPADGTALRQAYGFKRPQVDLSLDAMLLLSLDKWLKGEIDA